MTWPQVVASIAVGVAAYLVMTWLDRDQDQHYVAPVTSIRAVR